MQDAIDFVIGYYTLADRFWVQPFVERSQAVLSFQKARFLEKGHHE
jgi:hypothetical protein